MNQINLGVYRIEPNTNLTEIALKFHNERKQALIDIFENTEVVYVLDWGLTRDESPHEFVSLTIGVATSIVTNIVLIPVAKKILSALVDKSMDTLIQHGLSWLIEKLTKKHKEKKLLETTITLPNGEFITIKTNQGQNIEYDVNGQKIYVTDGTNA